MIVRPQEQRGLAFRDCGPDYDDGRLVVRPEDLTAFGDDEAIPFTTRELGMLVELYRNAGRVRSREELRRAVWGAGADVKLRAVDTAISRVRSKLDLALPDLSYVHSYMGDGYDFFQDEAYS